MKAPPVPLYVLMFEYGFETCYIELLDTSIVPKPTALILKFRDEVLEDKNLTVSDFHSLNDRIVSSNIVKDVWRVEDDVYYRIPMAKNIYDDVVKIMQSDFTKVSSFYKKLVSCPVSTLPKWPHNRGQFIMKHNIPVAVLKKHASMKEMVEKDLGVWLKDDVDLFRKFSYEFDVYVP